MGLDPRADSAVYQLDLLHLHPQELLRFRLRQPLLVGEDRRLEQLAVSVEGHGADGAALADDDHPAQRAGKLELIHVAHVRYLQ